MIARLRGWTASRRALVLGGAVLFGLSATLVGVDVHSHQVSGHQTSSHQTLTPHGPAAAAIPRVPPAPDTYNPEPARVVGQAPQRLRIASIGVDAAVESVGVTPELQLNTPRDTGNVGWYDLGSGPGQDGDTVLTGHLDTQSGDPAVFARLSQVKPGDTISVVAADGRSLNYRADSVSRVPNDRTPSDLYSTDGPARLTLITCAGTWDAGRKSYSDRLLVRATPS